MADENVREFALQIEDLDQEISGLNQKKAGVYRTAKDEDVDVGALRDAIAIRRKQTRDPKSFAKRSARVDEYLKLIDADEPPARVHAHEGETAAKGKATRRKQAAESAAGAAQ